MRSKLILLCLATTTLLAGCGEERARPPSATLTVFNAAPGFSNLSLRRGTTNLAALGTVQYPGIFSATVDSDTYNFGVDTQDSLSGVEVILAEFEAAVDDQRRFLFVLAEQNQSIVPIILAREPIDAGSAGFDLTVVNAFGGSADIDVWLTPPGTDLSSATPLGTLDFSETVVTEALQAGDYVVTLTRGGSAGTVLFTSATTALAGGNWTQMIIVPDANGYQDVYSVIVLGAASTNLTDVNAPARVRLINGAADGLARDFYLDDDFTTPFAADVAFGSATELLAVPNGTSSISVTPAGNASVVEAELSAALSPGSLYDVIVATADGAVAIVANASDRRPHNLHPRILMISAVSYYDTVDAFLFPEGTDISSIAPNWTLTSPVITQRVLFPSDSYELTVSDPVSDTVLLGPQGLTMEARGIYSIALFDSGDGTTVTALPLDDFQ